VPDAASPIGPILVSVIAGSFAAVVAAQIPAHLAARTNPADGLRTV